MGKDKPGKTRQDHDETRLDNKESRRLRIRQVKRGNKQRTKDWGRTKTRNETRYGQFQTRPFMTKTGLRQKTTKHKETARQYGPDKASRRRPSSAKAMAMAIAMKRVSANANANA
jgi:hypothetical protein